MEENTLSRGLKNRHIQLLAIGGAIGTGLFLGAGRSIYLTGPSILLAYMITGMICFFMMRAMGELLLSNTNYHSFVDFVKEYLGEGWAFITGWTYWFCWIFVAMADITATGLYLQYWLPDLPSWIPSLIILAFLFGINLLTVKVFGELEFWFALVKVVAIIALILVGGFLILTGFSTSAGVATLQNLWSYGGWFPKGVSGFLMSFQMVVFAFAGIEMIGLTAGEANNPEKVLPQAVNNIPLRIILFYLGALIVIMSIYPWSSIDPDKSPFVQVFSAAGIVAAASIVNFVVLTSAASACNSGIFSTSRMAYNLAKIGNAPSSLKKTTSRKVPANALVFSMLVVLGVIVLQLIMPKGLFVLVSSIATFCFIFIWTIITICHLKYRKERPELVAKNTFKMPLFPVMNYIVLAFFAFVVVTLGINEDTRLALMVTPVWFIVLGLIYKWQTSGTKIADIVE